MKRMIPKIFAVFVLVSFCINETYAQKGQVKRATKKYDDYSYIDARALYLDVANSDQGSSEVYAKLGDSYYFTAAYSEAVTWFDKLVNSGDDIDPEYYFRYALALKSTGDYVKSDQMMAKFNAANSTDSRGQLFSKDRDYISEIEKLSGRFEIKSLNFNSNLQDFAPTFYGDALVFSSNRSIKENQKKHNWNNQPFLDLYIIDDVQNSNPQLFASKINTKYHESTSVFTKEGDVMYFTRNNFTKSKLGNDTEGTNRLKLYKSKLEDGVWQKAEELPFNSEEYSVAHPALSADGKTLYFASDMPGTLGLSDIWKVAINEDDTFGEPVNLGNTINTEGRDTFPFVTQSGRLFFASDGHVGLGGLDIFVATGDTNTAEVLNVGKPVNSTVDDFSLILNEETGEGYFASNRANGVGNDDIYNITPVIPKCEQLITGVVTDNETKQVIAGTAVQLRNAENEVLAQTTTDAQGRYSFNDIACATGYAVRGEKETYKPAEASVTTADASGETVKDLILTPELVIREGDDLAIVLNLNPIYFDYDKSFIRPDAALELAKVISVMRQFPNLKIDVRSHTDSRGRDTYNKALSQRRNTSTIQYIIDQGIASNRLTGRGYGESQLLNRCSNGVKCSDEEHQLNRRSEFIVVER